MSATGVIDCLECISNYSTKIKGWSGIDQTIAGEILQTVVDRASSGLKLEALLVGNKHKHFEL